MRIPIITGSGGLNTDSDPVRSSYTRGRGIFDFAACMNIDISDKYRPSRRRGITRTVAEAAHSLFPVEDKYCVFVSGSNLCLLLPNLKDYIVVSSITPNLPLSCAVLDGVAYWANGIQTGKIVEGMSEAWLPSEDLVSQNVTREYYAPPIGQFIAYYNGRMYIGAEKVVWYSEPFAPDLFALSTNFLPFETNVQMVRPVTGGIFVSDSQGVWFLSGKDPESFNWDLVDDLPALPYSDKTHSGSFSVDDRGNYRFTSGGDKEGAFWLTKRGVMYGTPDGAVHSITEKKIDTVTQGVTGAIMVDEKVLIGKFLP